MRIHTKIAAMAASTTLALALFGGAAFADTSMADQDMAAKLQQEIALNPELAEYQIEVMAKEGGGIELLGIIDDADAYSALQGILDDMEGLGEVDNRVIRQ